MKFILTLLLFMLSFFDADAGRIDSLTNEKDVENFLLPLYQSQFGRIHTILQLKKPDSIQLFSSCTKSIKRKSTDWKKTDFNADGKSDLFAIAYVKDTVNGNAFYYEALVVIQLENDSFRLLNISKFNSIDCFSVELIFVDNIPCLRFVNSETRIRLDSSKIGDTSHVFPHSDQLVYYQAEQIDTLAFMFSGFIELHNAKYASKRIESVYFEYEPGGILYPKVRLNVFRDRTAFCFNGEGIDNFAQNNQRRVSEEVHNDVFRLIEYLDIESMKNYFSREATHLSIANITIFYSNGTSKTIHDYGMEGSFGLKLLYEKLLNICPAEKTK